LSRIIFSFSGKNKKKRFRLGERSTGKKGEKGEGQKKGTEKRGLSPFFLFFRADVITLGQKKRVFKPPSLSHGFLTQ
jgi:hypothetical protein